MADAFASVSVRFASSEAPSLNAGLLRSLRLAAAIFGTLMGAIVCAITYYHYPEKPFYIIAGALPFLLMQNVLWVSTLNRLGNVRYAFFCSFLGGISVAVLMTLAGRFATVEFFLVALLVGATTTLVALLPKVSAICRQTADTRVGLPANFARECLGHFLRMSAALGIGGPIHWLCLTLLHGGPSGKIETAAFNAFYQIYLIIVFVPSALGSIVIPWLMQGNAQTRENFANRLTSIWLYFGLSLSATGIVGILSYFRWSGSLPIVYSGRSEEAILLLVASILAGLVAFGAHAFVACGRVGDHFNASLLYSAIYLGTSTLLLSFYSKGMLGIVVALLLANLVHFLIQVVWLRSGRWREVTRA